MGLDTQENLEIMLIVTIITVNIQDNNHLAAVAMHSRECSLGVSFLKMSQVGQEDWAFEHIKET